MAAAVFFLILLTSVAIHEAGHLGAALATGMKVEKYYVGMGPKAFSRQVRGVEVGLRWLPIGGYVKIPGMDLRRAEEMPPGTYAHSPWYSQVFVAVAGPLTHWLIAFVLFCVAIAFFLPSYTSVDGPTVQAVEPATAGFEAGIRSGDLIVSVDGEAVSDWAEVGAVASASGETASIEVVRVDGSEATLEVPTSFEGVYAAPYEPMALSTGEVISESARLTGEVTVLTVQSLGRIGGMVPDLVSSALGRAPITEERPRSLVGIADVATDSASGFGWYGVLSLAAQLNLFFGIINLLPVYPLDGGHIVGAVVNRLTRSTRKVRQAALTALTGAAYPVVAALGVLFLASVTVDILDIL